MPKRHYRIDWGRLAGWQVAGEEGRFQARPTSNSKTFTAATVHAGIVGQIRPGA
jgi:hypothetical protein